MTATQTPVDAAVAHLIEFDRYYRLNLWPPASVADRQHDMNVMWRHNDLDAAMTELHTAAGAVLLEFTIAFRGPNSAGALASWPLVDRKAVAGGRLVVRRRGHETAYRNQLRLEWNPAKALHKPPADDLPDRDTGGGQVRVSADQRRRLVVTRTGGLFAFADQLDDPTGPHVFLHPEFAPPGFQFHVGQRLTAQLVLAPSKGVQARSIRQA